MHKILSPLTNYIACFFKYSSFTIERVAILVDFNITLGALPALKASSHLEAHKHHLSPSHKPGKLYSGILVLRSLPTDFEKLKNSFVIIQQTVCKPTSSTPVLQQLSL